jgi:hypothetical protein
MIRIGDTTTHDFVVDLEAMRRFQEMSADRSRIHCDEVSHASVASTA